MTASIRLATEHDAASIQSIYAPYVSETVISFELEPPSVEEMLRRMREAYNRYPWLVCEYHKEVIGYVYAGSHSARAAYDWSVNVTVYIYPHYHRAGVGRALYTSLFQILRLQGFYNAYAGVTLPNAGSVGLHEAMGFEPIGVYRNAGYKMGAWHDVGWWQLQLQNLPTMPTAPINIEEVNAWPEWELALRAGVPLLRL